MAQVNGTQVAQMAKDQIALLTGLRPETVSRLIRDGDGWHVAVDMVELKRIPASTEVLATYDILLDEAGSVVQYKRTRRYYRGDVAADQG